jgi:hypothetical protein
MEEVMTMTVKELIEVLSEMHPDKPVMIDDVMNSSFTEYGQDIEITDVDEVVEYADKVMIR